MAKFCECGAFIVQGSCVNKKCKFYKSEIMIPWYQEFRNELETHIKKIKLL